MKVKFAGQCAWTNRHLCAKTGLVSDSGLSGVGGVPAAAGRARGGARGAVAGRCCRPAVMMFLWCRAAGSICRPSCRSLGGCGSAPIWLRSTPPQLGVWVTGLSTGRRPTPVAIGKRSSGPASTIRHSVTTRGWQSDSRCPVDGTGLVLVTMHEVAALPEAEQAFWLRKAQALAGLSSNCATKCAPV